MHTAKTKKAKVVLSLLLSVIMVFSIITIGATSVSAATPTGIGLSAFALRAYNEGWAYVWGGMSEGAVDCSGLFKCYNSNIGGVRTDMLSSSQSAGLDWGYVSSGIPRVHGLGLHKPGHVGVYVGSDRAIDARGTNWGVIDSSVWSLSWVEWYKVVNVSYPTTGWVRFDGDSFYYEDGQYIINTSRTFDGVKYTFDSKGKSDKHPSENSYKETDYSTAGSSGGSSSDNSSSSSQYLKVGSQGSKVEEVQKKLKALGYFEDEISGYFGTYTAACVKEFQKDAKIEVDGVVGPEFWSTINSDNAPRKAGSTSADESTDADDTYEEGTNDTNDTNDSAEDATQAPDAQEVTEAPAPVEEATEAQEEPTQAPTEEPTQAPTDAPTQAPTEAPTEPDLTVYYGDSGEAVASMQNRLTELGFYHGEVTGVFDDYTLNALHAYFAASELRAENLLTEEQQAVFYSSAAAYAPAAQAVTADDKGEIVSEIQQDLVKLGYMDKVSGTYDDTTRGAVKTAQANFVLEVTGEADEVFVEALELEVTRQESQTVKNASVKNAENPAALTPAQANPIEVDSPELPSNSSVVMLWLAGIMFMLAVSGTVVYIKHRRARVNSK